MIHSVYGTNFVGANNELTQLYEFLKARPTQAVADYCSQEIIG